MRLWSLHPRFLDPKGLVALWREGLLAQAVIRGKTRGYRHHPQLVRFLAVDSPTGAIAEYLRGVHAESIVRGYKFDAKKISRAKYVGQLDVTQNQLEFEREHLFKKLAARSPEWLAKVEKEKTKLAHPFFKIKPGKIADWERP